MIQLIPVENAKDLSSDIQQLYEESFPPDERRNWTQLTEILQNETFSINKLFSGEKFIGLFSFWNMDEFIFIEHFAIQPEEQSKGFGTQTILQFIQEQQLPVILEVEKPETDSALKRIRFYERLNFTICSGNYFQPPYPSEKNKVEMSLMSFPHSIPPADFESVVKKIHHTVYQFG